MRLISRITLSISRATYIFSEKIYRLVNILDALNVAVLKPEEMAAIGRKAYTKMTEAFGSEESVKYGLVDWEKTAVERFAAKGGSFLVLGAGGGRETIALAKMGFRVVGIDSSPLMLKMGRENAERWKVAVDFREGDFVSPDTGSEKFDYCLLSCVMYSSVPSTDMRVTMLRNIRNILSDKGVLIIHFLLRPKNTPDKGKNIKLMVARLFRGNTGYRTGDSFSTALHFMRYFPNDEEVMSEIGQAGFRILDKEAYPESEYMALSPVTCGQVQ